MLRRPLRLLRKMKGHPTAQLQMAAQMAAQTVAPMAAQTVAPMAGLMGVMAVPVEAMGVVVEMVEVMEAVAAMAVGVAKSEAASLECTTISCTVLTAES